MAAMTSSLAGKEIRLHVAQSRLPGQCMFFYENVVLALPLHTALRPHPDLDLSACQARRD